MRNGLQPNAVWYACLGAFLGTAVALFTQIQTDLDLSRTVIAFDEQQDQPGASSLVNRVPSALDIAPLPLTIDAPQTRRTSSLKIQRGDTLLGVLQRNGIESAQAHAAVSSLSSTFDPRDIRVGQEVRMTTVASAEDAAPLLDAFRIGVGPGHDVVVLRNAQGAYSSDSIKAETVSQAQAFRGSITTSLYESAVDQGVPPQVLIEMIRLFSYDVDFQRDIRENDAFEIMFDRQITKDGVVVKNEDIQYASMTLRGDVLKIYAFEHEDGLVNYYNEQGKGIRKALMRTPINGARLSSSFGRRKHPVLGYTKMHRGVDFAAPHGTPIYAAGDGVIEKRQRWSSFGNYIRIRHGDGFSTAYAHMRSFAKGHSVGTRVKQGAVIGYVGTTGRSTGPHLHYEVLRNGTQVNPMKVRFPASKILAGADLDGFQERRETLDRKWFGLIEAPELAFLDESGMTAVALD